MKVKLPFKCFPLLFLLLGAAQTAVAQFTASGRVTDARGEILIGATIAVKGGGQGTTTDNNGMFTLSLPGGGGTLLVSYTGYQTATVQVSAASPRVEIVLEEDAERLGEVTVVGSRFAPRTAITTPVPIDNIKRDELLSTGQTSFDKQLTYTVPAFNSSNQTISDATAHFDPFDLRGLGPSRTLILVNGKRKNPSSLVYINDTPGKGEVGVDMKSIPAAAIERVEVLRDGASAQYGSDAIAGVVNVVLRKDYEHTTANVFGGMTSEGDGEFYGYNINTGAKIGERGFVSITHSFSDQKETNRAGTPGQDFLFGVDDSWTRANPDLGMIVGQPNITSGDFFANASVSLGDHAELYGYGGFTYRRGRSYALYRTPYWRPTDFGLLTEPGQTYQGFHPTFDTDILDNTQVIGIRGDANRWKYDVSFTRGGNRVDYTVYNSINTTMGPKSPTVFRVGGYEFRNNIFNMDLLRKFGIFSLALGTEMRAENFIANAGEEASYIDGMDPQGYGPAGAQSFPGLQPQNEVDAFRYNIGGYIEGTLDVTDDFLLGAAVRTEKYSDFGNVTNYKINARYKFLDDRLSLRGSLSTGFRAPSLHQIYLSNIQTLISGATVSEQGTFNNESSVLRRLGVGKLKAETAQNITVGIAAKPIRGLYLSVDYYNITVDDRIVYSSSIATGDTTSDVYAILQQNNITSLKFFLNAVNTQTSGVDIVATYTFSLPKGALGINLAANFSKNSIEGRIATPEPLSRANIDVFDRKEQSRLLTARPNNKIILGLSYEIGRFRAVLNNTRFGEVTWQNSAGAQFDQTFSAKIVTDVNLSYRFSDAIGFGIVVNNLLDVYPDEIDTHGDVVTDLGGRFRYPWEVNQFGFNGMTLSANLNIRF
ncbi:MAG: TonB-dependent receptor [Saprospirales bacterium]|nr:TonB-dependent receptor [Saprospirales bacterium]